MSVSERRAFVDRKFAELEAETRGGIKLLYTSNPGDGTRYVVSTPKASRTLRGLKEVETWLDGVEVGIAAMTEGIGWEL